MRTKTIVAIVAATSLFACKDDDPETPDAKACFTYAPSAETLAGEEVTFANCSENASEYTWDFGDGGSSSQEAPMHSFETSGEFTVRLVAANENSTDDVEQVITVTANPITLNRWKSGNLWEDYCDTVTQTISGHEHFTFRPDHTVLYELILNEPDYGCTGDSEEAGTWEMTDSNQYVFTADDGDQATIELIENRTKIKWTEDDGEVSYWTKE